MRWTLRKEKKKWHPFFRSAIIFLVSTLFFSQDLSALSKRLKEDLAQRKTSLFSPKWLIVPKGLLRQWLMVELAKGGCFAGCRVISLEDLPFDTRLPSPLKVLKALWHFLQSPPEEIPSYTDPLKKLYLASHLQSLFFLYAQNGGIPPSPSWQYPLFSQIFPSLKEAPPKVKDPIYCFGYDFLSPLSVSFFAGCENLHLYLFSPSAQFWEDLYTPKEQRALLSSAKKREVSQTEQLLWHDSFAETPSLLAHFGKAGKKTLSLLDSLSIDTQELYSEVEETASWLHLLQRHLLFFEPFEEIPYDQSVQLIETSGLKWDEINALVEEIETVFLKEKIPFSEMLVLAPDISPYLPFIESLFASHQIPYRIFGGNLPLEKGAKGLFALLDLAQKKWELPSLISLFETTPLCSDIKQWSDWMTELFRIDLSWETAIEKKLQSVVFKTSYGFDFDGFEEFSQFLLALKEDLFICQKESLPLSEWKPHLETLFAKYLKLEEKETIEVERILSSLQEDLSSETYPFCFVAHLFSLQKKDSIHPNALHAVSMGSIEEGAIKPCKALFLIGMDEESFPRKPPPSSLSLLPFLEKGEKDRYLFLKLLLNTQDLLRIFYGAFSSEDRERGAPSLLVQELYRGPVQSIPPENIPLPIPSHFSIQKPSIPPPQPTKVLSLQKLSAWARSPWKAYLKEVHGISLQHTNIPSFAQIRSQQQIEETPFFPPGIFREAIELDIAQREKRLLQHFDQKPFPLSLLESVEAPDGDALPPIALTLSFGQEVLIVGEVPSLLSEGALHIGDDTIGSLLKTWPVLLAGLVALEKNQIYMAKTGAIKQVENPKQGLKSFVEYFLLCESSLSPLLPDWADPILRSNEKELKEFYDDPIVAWIKPKLDKEPLAKDFSWVSPFFEELTKLYPKRGT